MLEILSSGLTGTIVGVVGIGLGYLFYLRSQQKARLSYQHEHVTLIGSGKAAFPEEVTVLFNALPVPRVTASKFILWNSGNRTILGDDVVSSDPLRFEVLKDEKILKYAILRQPRDVNGWVLRLKPANRVDLRFDFLDPGDGITIEITHTQPRSGVSLCGTIRGMPVGLQDFGRPWHTTDLKPLRFFRGRKMSATLLSLGILMIASELWEPQIRQLWPGLSRPEHHGVHWPWIAMGLFYILFSAFHWWSYRRRYPRT